MPELPEVETVRQILKKEICGKKISKVEVFYEKIISMDKDTFAQTIKNQIFLDIERKGKYLIFILNNGYLISHLRMEGKFKIDADIDKHSHLIFYFSDGHHLIYHDVRKFGRMLYFPKETSIFEIPPLSLLGKEPFACENGNYLYEKVKNSNLKLKQILLDQSIFCGIGNIYADEICFASKLHPCILGKELTLKMCDVLTQNAKEILNKAIQLGGSTIKTYQSAHGVDGRFQIHLDRKSVV